MTDPRTVAVGLDVHKSSMRLAAMRAGELLAERTLAHDHEAVIAALRLWPGARVCQEAGPTGCPRPAPHHQIRRAELMSPQPTERLPVPPKRARQDLNLRPLAPEGSRRVLQRAREPPVLRAFAALATALWHAF
jgi:hypothetical protein